MQGRQATNVLKSINNIMKEKKNILAIPFIALPVSLGFTLSRPSLPPSKQANKNLILKAISEAQESVTKTTNYATGKLFVSGSTM